MAASSCEHVDDRRLLQSRWRRRRGSTPLRYMAAAALVASLVAVPATSVAQGQRFPDVAPDHYAYEAVEWAADVGVTTGYEDGTFKPARPLSKRHAVVFMERYYDEILQAEESADFTRGDMMVLLKAINDGTLRDTEAESTSVAEGQRFPDVAPDHYAYEAVEWAADVGVTTGYEDGTFKPARPLSKRHAVVFMERYYDEILQAEESADFTRGDMMVLLKAINDGTIGEADTDTSDADDTSGADTSGAGVSAPTIDASSLPDGAYTAVSAGSDHTCGLQVSGEIYCWGSNSSQQRNEPEGPFTAVSAGSFHTCGLRADSTVDCWGANDNGKTDVPEGTYSTVSAGAEHTCAVRVDGTLACWGDNTHGQSTPPDGTFSAVDAGIWHSCAVATDGSVACWGNNGSGQTGAPDGSFSAVSAGWGHSCGLHTDGTATCWGWNQHGQLDVPGGAFAAVSAGSTHTCGLRSDGTITCWGSNEDENGNTVGQGTPSGGTFAAVSSGTYHTCGLRPSGAVACWGAGQLESGQPSERLRDAQRGIEPLLRLADRRDCRVPGEQQLRSERRTRRRVQVGERQQQSHLRCARRRHSRVLGIGCRREE